MCIFYFRKKKEFPLGKKFLLLFSLQSTNFVSFILTGAGEEDNN